MPVVFYSKVGVVYMLMLMIERKRLSQSREMQSVTNGCCLTKLANQRILLNLNEH